MRRMGLPAVMTRCDRGEGLVFAGDRVEWSGPVDVDAADVNIRWCWMLADDEGALAAAIRAGDVGAVDELVRRSAVPVPLLDELARVCAEREPDAAMSRVLGRELVDTRWQRALTRALVARNTASTAPLPDGAAEVVVAPTVGTIAHVRVLGDGTIAALETPPLWTEPRPDIARLTLVRGNTRATIDFAAPEGLSFALPSPARGDASTLIVSAYDERNRFGLFWRVDGDRVTHAWRCVLESYPQEFSTTARGLWIHCVRHHLFVDERCAFDAGAPPHKLPAGDARESPRGIARGMDGREGRVLVMGEWLPVLSREVLREGGGGWISERLSWVHLDEDRPPIRQAWGHPHGNLAVVGKLLLSASDDGLFRASPTQEPEQLIGRALNSLDVDGNSLWIADWEALRQFEFPSLRELLTVKPPHLTFNVERVGTGFIARGYSDWSWYDGAGRALYTTYERRDTRLARLADGTVACSAGEEVAVFVADGGLRRRTRLPFDGQILGATDEWFVYGAVSGGIPRAEADGLYAIDRDGAIVERLPTRVRPERTFYAGGSIGDSGAIGRDGVLVIEDRGMLRWRPTRAAAAKRAIVTPSRRVERAASAVKGETYSPRDDWPEPGRTVFCEDFLARDSEYGGTTGVAPEAALIVDDGSVATLVACKIAAGGVKARRGSTAIFVGCSIESSAEWQLDARSHVTLIDCTIAAPVDVRGPDDSTVGSNVHDIVGVDDYRVRLQERGAAAPTPVVVAPAPPSVEPQTRSVKPYRGKDGDYDALLAFAQRLAPIAFVDFHAPSDKLDEKPGPDEWGLDERTIRFGDEQRGFTVFTRHETIDAPAPLTADTVEVSVYGVDGLLRLRSTRAPRDGERTRELTIEVVSPRASEVLAAFDETFAQRQLDDDDLDALTRQAMRNLYSPMWPQALAAAERVLAQRPNDAAAAFAKGVALAALGDLNAAESVLADCVVAHPDNYDAWYNLGQVQLQLERPRKAIETFRRALAIDGKNHPSWYGLGRALEADGQGDAALDAYQTAVRTSPNPGGAFAYSGMDFTDAASAAIDRLKGRD